MNVAINVVVRKPSTGEIIATSPIRLCLPPPPTTSQNYKGLKGDLSLRLSTALSLTNLKLVATLLLFRGLQANEHRGALHEDSGSLVIQTMYYTQCYLNLWLHCLMWYLAKNGVLVHVTELWRDWWFTLSDSSFCLGFGGYDTFLSAPDVPRILVDGAVTGKLSHACNVLDNHLQPFLAILEWTQGLQFN